MRLALIGMARILCPPIGAVLAAGAFLRPPGDDHIRTILGPAIQGKADQYAQKFVKPAG